MLRRHHGRIYTVSCLAGRHADLTAAFQLLKAHHLHSESCDGLQSAICRYKQVCGFHGIFAGLLVALKQVLPESEVTLVGFLKFRAKVMSAWLLTSKQDLPKRALTGNPTLLPAAPARAVCADQHSCCCLVQRHPGQRALHNVWDIHLLAVPTLLPVEAGAGPQVSSRPLGQDLQLSNAAVQGNGLTLEVSLISLCASICLVSLL